MFKWKVHLIHVYSSRFCLNLLKHLNRKIHQPLKFADSAHKALRLERSIPNSNRWLQPKAMPAVVVAHRLLFCIPLPTVGVDPWSCPIGIPRYSKKKMLVSSRSCVTPFSGKAKKSCLSIGMDTLPGCASQSENSLQPHVCVCILYIYGGFLKCTPNHPL